LDYDEIAEVIEALGFIDDVAKKMFGQQRDYTEVNYLTKDNLKFGFTRLKASNRHSLMWEVMDNHNSCLCLSYKI
jgi:hypothetical protein